MLCLYRYITKCLYLSEKALPYYANTERKTRRVSRCPTRAPEGRTTGIPVRRSEPHPSGTAATERLPAGSDEGLGYLVQPQRARRRQYTMVRIVLGILRAILQ